MIVMDKILRINFGDDPNLGLYGFATEKTCFLGFIPKKKIEDNIKDTLHVKIETVQPLATDFTGIFLTGNMSGLLLPEIIRDETEELKNKVDVLFLDSDHTALGNLVLMNDSGIVISPLLKKHKRKIEKFFGLKCEMTKIIGSNVIGTIAFATNSGCIIHPKAKEREIKIIEKALSVEVNKGTVNFGSPFPGAGLKPYRRKNIRDVDDNQCAGGAFQS